MRSWAVAHPNVANKENETMIHCKSGRVRMTVAQSLSAAMHKLCNSISYSHEFFFAYGPPLLLSKDRSVSQPTWMEAVKTRSLF